MTRLLLIFCLSVWLVAPARATTYYVDMVSGSDAATGLSSGAAWQHVPGQTTATGVAAATTLLGGDVIAFVQGVVNILDSPIIFKNSGSVGNPIIYEGDILGNGTKAIIDGSYSVGIGFTDNSALRSNITVRNIELRNIGGWADDEPILEGKLVMSVDVGTDIVTTSTTHDLTVGTLVQVTYDGWAADFLTGAKNPSTFYYVVEVPSTDTLKLSSTLGGVSVDFTTSLPGEFRIFRPVTSSTAPSGTGFSFQSKGDNILVENVYAHRLGTWRNTAPLSGIQSVAGTAVKLENNNGVIIRDCTFEKVRVGVSIKSSLSNGPIENITVQDCVIHNTVWGVDIAPYSNNAVLDNILIKNCTISGQAMYDIGNWRAFGSKPHTDGVFIRNAQGVAGIWDVTVDGCLFLEDDPQLSGGGTSDIFLDYGSSAKIQNCIFLNSPRSTGAVAVGKTKQSYQSVELYNNTFYTRSKCVAVAWTGGSNPDYVAIKNNIIWRTSDTANLSAFCVDPSKVGTTFDIDYNIYYASTEDPLATSIFNSSNGSSYKTWAQWRAAYPLTDANSAVIDPLFASAAGIPSTWQMNPLTGSPAIGAGSNLTSLFTTDFTGTTRSPSGAWTVGAYSSLYTPPSDVTAPTLASASINATGGTLSLLFDEPVTGLAAVDYALSSGNTLGTPTGSGTSWTMSISPLVQDSASPTLAYTAGATEDIAGNSLATFSGAAITNNSLEPTPDPPKALRRGRGAGKMRAGR